MLIYVPRKTKILHFRGDFLSSGSLKKNTRIISYNITVLCFIITGSEPLYGGKVEGHGEFELFCYERSLGISNRF